MLQKTYNGVLLTLSAICAVIAVLTLTAGCGMGSDEGKEYDTMPTDDIKSVMESHVRELMAIDGVVGVAIGALDDGRQCIRVLLVNDSTELRQKIPRELDGFPVDIDVTGEIRAMSDEDE
jgi:hypothetical protein